MPYGGISEYFEAGIECHLSYINLDDGKNIPPVNFETRDGTLKVLKGVALRKYM